MNDLMTFMTFINDHHMVLVTAVTLVTVTGIIVTGVCSLAKTVFNHHDLDEDNIDVKDDRVSVGTVKSCSDGTFIFENAQAATQYATLNSDIDAYDNFVLSPEQYRAMGEGKTLMLKAGDCAIIIEALREGAPQ